MHYHRHRLFDPLAHPLSSSIRAIQYLSTNPRYPLFDPPSCVYKQLKKHVSCELDRSVDTQLCKLRDNRSRVFLFPPSY